MEDPPSTPLQPKQQHLVRFRFQEKENVLLQTATATLPSTPLRIAQHQPTPHSTPISSCSSTKSPAVSASKLLRKHFEQIAITSPKRRLLNSGAIRVRRRLGTDITHVWDSCVEEDVRGRRNCSNNTPGTLLGVQPTKFVQRTDHDPVASTLLQGEDDMDIGVVDFKSGNLMDCPGIIRPVATKLRR